MADEVCGFRSFMTKIELMNEFTILLSHIFVFFNKRLVFKLDTFNCDK